MEESYSEGFILAILLSAALRGVAEDTGARESNVGIVGGTVEDVSGAIVPKAELTLRALFLDPLTPTGSGQILDSDPNRGLHHGFEGCLQ